MCLEGNKVSTTLCLRHAKPTQISSPQRLAGRKEKHGGDGVDATMII
jgi:hypothetical protein